MKSVASATGKLVLLFAVLGAAVGCSTTEKMSATSAVLRGMVYNTSRTPVLDMKVSLIRDGRETGSVLTDIHGRYFIPEVPYGPVTLRFLKDSYEPLDWSFSFDKPTQVVYVQVSSLNELLDRAAGNIQKRQWADAASCLERIRKMQPDNAIASYLEGEMMARQGNPEAAAALLEKLSTDKSTYLAVELALADIYQNTLAQPDKALIHLRKAALIRDDIDIENRITTLEKQ